MNINKLSMLKQKLLLFAFFSFLGVSGFSQMGGVHNYSDSSYISPRNMSQQSDFVNNKGNFPSKPRDQYQVGIFGGLPYVDGDCPMAIRGVGNGLESYAYGFGVHIRKAMGYVFSVRASFAYYNMLGLDYQPNSNFNNSPTILNLYSSAPRGYIHNHRTMAFAGGLEGLVSLSNIMFHTKQKRWNVYGVFGYTALSYNTKMNLIDGNNGWGSYAQLFRDVAVAYSAGVKRPELRKMLRDGMDNNYETQAEVNNRRPGITKNWHLRHCFSSGVGIEYRMGKRWSANFEYKRIQTRDDYVDGWFRQSGDLRYAVFTSEWDNIAFTQLGTNFNIGNSKKRVPPLWWLNPLEFAYASLSDKGRDIKALKFKLKDDDGDGVVNEMDQEPNTPEGCPVDTHGITADTDGDGVPDCNDKEKLTLQKCFPVNADGVGNCPEPICCDSLGKEIERFRDSVKTGKIKVIGGKQEGKDGTCGDMGELPSVQFSEGSYKLNKAAEALLALVADKMKANPNCNVRVVGYGITNNKASQQLSWDKVNAVIKYLVEQQGISDSRFIFEYGKGTDGDTNTVDLSGTADSGSSKIDAPYPQFRKAKPMKSAKTKQKGVFGRH